MDPPTAHAQPHSDPSDQPSAPPVSPAYRADYPAPAPAWTADYPAPAHSAASLYRDPPPTSAHSRHCATAHAATPLRLMHQLRLLALRLLHLRLVDRLRHLLNLRLLDLRLMDRRRRYRGNRLRNRGLHLMRTEDPATTKRSATAPHRAMTTTTTEQSPTAAKSGRRRHRRLRDLRRRPSVRQRCIRDKGSCRSTCGLRAAQTARQARVQDETRRRSVRPTDRSRQAPRPVRGTVRWWAGSATWRVRGSTPSTT